MSHRDVRWMASARRATFTMTNSRGCCAPRKRLPRNAESHVQNAIALGGDRDGAAFFIAPGPSPGKKKLEKRLTQPATHMRSRLAPHETKCIEPPSLAPGLAGQHER